MQADRGIGTALHFMGSLSPKAQFQLEQATSSYRSRSNAVPCSCGGDLILGWCDFLGYLARNLWYLGYPDQAIKRAGISLELAQKLDHPFSLAFVCVAMRDISLVSSRAPTFPEICKARPAILPVQGRFPITALTGMVVVCSGLGPLLCSEKPMRELPGCSKGSGNHWQAEGYGISHLRSFPAGQAGGTMKRLVSFDNGLRLVEEALAPVMERTEERNFNAEWHTDSKASFYGQAARSSEAEASFRQAIEVARHQEARSLELRATLSLARLLQKEGRSEEAKQLLSEIYGWFTEGFDTPDLKDAKALLEELGKEGFEESGVGGSSEKKMTRMGGNGEAE